MSESNVLKFPTERTVVGHGYPVPDWERMGHRLVAQAAVDSASHPQNLGYLIAPPQPTELEPWLRFKNDLPVNNVTKI